MRTLSKKMCIPTLLALFTVVLAIAACGDGNSDYSEYSAAIALARSEIKEDIDTGRASSGSVTILDKGRVVYAEGIGIADRESNTVVDDATLFNIGSVSKLFCSVAVMLLVDDGEIDLDFPITQYLPDFEMADPRYVDITVRMLLNHTSGVPGTEYANNLGYAYNDDIYQETLDTLSRSNLKAAPGQTAPYCNDGFTLAEMIVAEVSGQEFMDFVSERILAPLSLSRTGASVGERSDANYAAYYQADTGKKVPAEVLSVHGAGGLSSTPTDLVMFADSFSEGGSRILSDESVAEMIKAQPSAFASAVLEESGINPEMAYGLGFDMVEYPLLKDNGIKVVGKGGDSDDYHAMLVSVPAERLSVAVIEAGHGCRASDIALDILMSILQAKWLVEQEEAAEVPTEPQPIPQKYAEFQGYYSQSSDLAKISFNFQAGTATLDFIEGGETNSGTLNYRDGKFFTESGNVMSILSLDGRKCIAANAFGGQLLMIASQMVPELFATSSLDIDLDGRRWLRRNVKPFESIGLAETHVINSATYSDLSGYVDFAGPKRVTSGRTAGMISDVVRDQTELQLIDRGGNVWAWVSNMLYSPDSYAVSLADGSRSVSIGEDGFNKWFRVDANLVLEITKPDNARVIVFGSDGSISYDSIIDDGEISVEAGSLVELAGTAGDVIDLVAVSSSGS